MPQHCTAPMSTEQLGQIVEDSASEVYIFDPESYRFLLVNKGARENLGYSSRELAELTPWDIKPEYTEGQFKEMLTPLLSGEVVLSVGQENDGITIAVADTGIGMDATSSAPGGTGLGKKIINGLTRQIGAELQLTSGESGTSYRIDVPLAV